MTAAEADAILALVQELEAAVNRRDERAVLDAIAHPERHIARFLKALGKGLRLARLIPIAPPAHALAANAPCALGFADTS